MKKRTMAFVLCLMMIFTSVPLTPVGNLFSVEAAAAADISQLQDAYESVPPKEDWGLFIDTSTLGAWCELAEQYMNAPSMVTQSAVDNCTEKLKAAVAALKYHTRDITLNRSAITANVGDSFTLRASLTPSTAGDSVTWKSSNTSVATVSQSGVVNVLKYSASSVTISATSNGHTASCVLTVENPLNHVSLSQATASLYEGQKISLKATVTGIDTGANPSGNIVYTWDSSNTAVATVSDTGAVTATGKGSCTISVTATDGGNKFTAKCSVSVSAITYITQLQPITVTSSSTLSMTAGETVDFQLSILPTNASIKTISWKSSDTTVATVSSATVTNSIASVRITAKASGKTRITYSATDGSGKSGYFVVEVKPLVSSISLSDSIKVITLDSTSEKITATVLPTNAGNQVLSWSSSNPNICEVDYAGRLYPKANGSCVISCSTTDGSKLTVNSSVRVAPKAASVALNKGTYTLNNGNSVTLKATVTTIEGSTYNDVSWSSDNTKIATVTQSGKITAKYPGTVVIKATALDGTGKAAVCIITVNQPVTGVSLPSTKSVAQGGTVTITPTFAPTYASNKNVTWSSSDTSVATVNSSGLVTGKKTGSAVITVKTADGGYTAKCTVKVVVETAGVKLNKSSASINKGATVTLTATVTPSNASNKNVTWKSDNLKVATVSAYGVVTGVAGGTCTITCTTASGGYVAKCKITVIEAVSGVSLKYSKLNMYTTQEYTLSPIIAPSTASNKGVKWSSSNTSVATVSSAGLITALKVGTAIITVKTTDGGYSASATITVTKKVPVTSLKLNISSKTLNKGSSYAIVATITPSNASETGIIWTSSDSTVATVSSSGVVKALKAGNTVITAKTKDGGYTQKCTIKVISRVTGVKLNATSVSLANGKSKTLKATIYPSDATYKTVTWKTTNKKIATVSSSGVITAVGSGNCSIIVTTSDGGFSASCNVSVYNPVKGIQINTTSINVPKGESRLLSAIISPSNATNKSVTWSSANTTIATVSSSGQVTGRRAGSVLITATSADGGYKATCTVKVIQLATKITLDYTSVTIDAGKTKTIGFSVSPSTATYKTVTWKSSDTSVCKVSSKGVVTAVGAGTATIRATSTDKNATASCKITVTQPVKSIVLNYKTLSVKVGSMKAITATVKPNNATNSLVGWTSSNNKIATVDINGVVKGIRPGKVTITATSVNGELKASCVVTVTRPVTGVKLNKTSITINVGRSTTVTPTILPSDATNKKVTWSSNNYDVATVNSAGKITAKSAGYAEITARTSDGGYRAVCKVLVIQPVTGVALNATSKYIEVGEYSTLKATVKPSTASNKNLTWSSSDKSICKVSSSGKILGVKTGTATITVKTVDGSFTAKCKVSVVRKVTSVKLNKSTLTMYLGKTCTLTATVLPKDATVKTLKWYTSNSSVVSVSQSGALKALKIGTSVITVKSTDGSHVAKCTVTVKKAPTKVTLNKTSITLYTAKAYTLSATVSPSDATNKSVTWTSSNKSVAKVSSKGVVTAVAKGSATITATTENGLKAICKVTVKQHVTGVSLNKSEYVIYAGNSAKLSATILPTNANDQSLTWATSNASVLTVSGGTIKAIKAGTAVITVKTTDGGYTAKCTVTVRQHVTEVILNKTALSLKKGEESDLTVQILPTNATNKAYTFSSSDKSIVSVSSTGHLIALKGGTAEITVTSNDLSLKAKCMVTVIEPVSGMNFDKTDMTLYVGETDKIIATISPADASNQAITWTTTNPAVLSVSSDGTVKALKSGTAVIMAVTSDGGYTASCGVTVLQKATGITMNEPTLSMKNGSEYTLIATVQPDDAYNKKCTWSSSSETVATVTEDGKITAINPGKTTITATSEDGSFEVTCVVTVYEPVTGISFIKDNLTIYKGSTETIVANIAPANATNKDITWTSSDKSVVTVENGKVTAIGKGNAFVTATTADGEYVAMCKIEVIIAVGEISVDKNELTLSEGDEEKITETVTPDDAENKEVIWTSSDESVATVENGNIKAISKGNAVITVTSKENSSIFAEINVEVIRHVSRVELDVNEKTISNGESFDLVACVIPSDANNIDLLWSSSDESVAKVDENGKVTALSRGKTTITAKSVDGEKTAECVVIVKQLVKDITFDKAEYIVTVGGEIKPEVSIAPENADDKALSWTSTDISVATVSDGVIKGKGAGTTEIIVNSKDNGAQAKIIVHVYTPASSIAIDKTDVMWVNDKVQATYEVLPSTTTDKSVTWSSSDENIATVENGMITAVSAGTAVIKAKAVYGEAEGSLTITVKQQITGIFLDRNQKSMNIGDEFTLKATVLPENAYDKSVTWISENSEIVAVNKDGLVTAKKTGTANIKAVTKDENIVAVCTVKVIKLAQSVVLSKSSLSIEKGKTTTLSATVYPLDATEREITWASDNTDVATVDSNGVVTANKGGYAKITAFSTTEDVYAECNIRVDVLSTSIKLDKTSATLNCGETLKVSADILPLDATDQTIEWTSTDNRIATVENGIITAVEKGNAEITAKMKDSGVFAKIAVTINKKVTGVKLSSSKLTIEKGESKAVSVSVIPADATNLKYTFSSSDTKIVTVDESGNITAKNVGRAFIYVTTDDGSYQDICSIVVTQKPLSVSLDKAEISAAEGETVTLHETVLPENATDKSVKWESDNEEIATVSNGIITAKTMGETIIRVRTNNNNCIAECKLTVTKPVSSVELSPKENTVYIDKQVEISATVLPENATDKTLVWTSADDSIATVENGIVTGHKIGTVTITAMSVDGIHSGSCEITVRKAVEKIELNYDKYSIDENSEFTLTAYVLPTDASNRAVTWTSSDDSIATVVDGKVKAIAKGEVKITVSSVENSEITAVCDVTVTKPVSSVELSPKENTVYIDKQVEISATVLPENATDKTLVWTSADDGIATVENGIVTGHKIGTVTITATSVDGIHSGSCEITVRKAVEKIELNYDKYSIDENSEFTLTADVLPTDASNRAVTWTSSDDSIATVVDGKVKAIAKGEVKITASSVENPEITVVCDVTVTKPVSSVELSPKENTVYIDKQVEISATVLPENATDKTLLWTSADDSIATVDNGIVTGHKIGTVTITAMSVDGIHSGSCEITVRKAVEKIELNNYNCIVPEATAFTLTADVLPADASNKDITWTSSDEKIATVEGGIVKALSVGKVKITVTSNENPEITAVCEVEVTRAVTGISISDLSKTIYIGHADSLKANVIPADATNKAITYKSSDEAVVSVDAEGNLTAKKPGSAFIVAKTVDGEFGKICNITVKRAVEKITLDSTEMFMDKKSAVTILATVTPADATNADVIWSTSNSEIATVSGGIVKTGTKGGVVTITASSIQNNNVFATCTITVKETVENVDLDDIELNMRKGTSSQLTAIVTPTDATIKDVKWTTTDAKVATVDNNGKVTAVGVGTASIIVTTVDGELKALCSVRVLKEIDSLSIKCDSASIRNGLTTKVIAETIPAVTDEKIKFSSDNEQIATVDSNGIVTGISGGTTTITAISSVSGKTAECEITVIQTVTGIAFTSPSISGIYTGTTGKLSYNVSPSNATNQEVTWKSSNTKVATVTPDGTINYIGKGTVTITATSVDNSTVSSTCTVTVVQAPESVEFDITSMSARVGGSISLVANVLPLDSVNVSLVWESSNSSIASVDQNGKVTAKSKGVAVITAKTVNGKIGTCTVTVS